MYTQITDKIDGGSSRKLLEDYATRQQQQKLEKNSGIIVDEYGKPAVILDGPNNLHK